MYGEPVVATKPTHACVESHAAAHPCTVFTFGEPMSLYPELQSHPAFMSEHRSWYVPTETGNVNVGGSAVGGGGDVNVGGSDVGGGGDVDVGGSVIAGGGDVNAVGGGGDGALEGP